MTSENRPRVYTFTGHGHFSRSEADGSGTSRFFRIRSRTYSTSIPASSAFAADGRQELRTPQVDAQIPFLPADPHPFPKRLFRGGSIPSPQGKEPLRQEADEHDVIQSVLDPQPVGLLQELARTGPVSRRLEHVGTQEAVQCPGEVVSDAFPQFQGDARVKRCLGEVPAVQRFPTGHEVVEVRFPRACLVQAGGHRAQVPVRRRRIAQVQGRQDALAVQREIEKVDTARIGKTKAVRYDLQGSVVPGSQVRVYGFHLARPEDGQGGDVPMLQEALQYADAPLRPGDVAPRRSGRRIVR